MENSKKGHDGICQEIYNTEQCGHPFSKICKVTRRTACEPLWNPSGMKEMSLQLEEIPLAFLIE